MGSRGYVAIATIGERLLLRRPLAGLQHFRLNNKAKVTMRKSYGFCTFRCLELVLYHSLGKLPEPESTHDFFLTNQIFLRY